MNVKREVLIAWIGFFVLLGIFLLIYFAGGESAPCDDLCHPDVF